MKNDKNETFKEGQVRILKPFGPSIAMIKIPEDLIPADARVEIEAKKAAGYFSDKDAPDSESLRSVKGRDLT